MLVTDRFEAMYNIYNIHTRTMKTMVVNPTIPSPTVAPQDVVMTSRGVTSDDEALNIMRGDTVQYYKEYMKSF